MNDEFENIYAEPRQPRRFALPDKRVCLFVLNVFVFTLALIFCLRWVFSIPLE